MFKPQPSAVNMKITLNIVGGLLVVFGAIWFLQGINVLPGSFMTGQIRWAVLGGSQSRQVSRYCSWPIGEDWTVRARARVCRE